MHTPADPRHRVDCDRDATSSAIQARSQKFTAGGANLGNGGKYIFVSHSEQLWLT
jgi:hypothetical protein